MTDDGVKARWVQAIGAELGARVEPHRGAFDLYRPMVHLAVRSEFRGKGSTFVLSIEGCPMADVKPALEGAGYREPARAVVAVEQLGPIAMTRQTWFDRLGKWLSINRELWMGDPDFDRAVFVDTAMDAGVMCTVLEQDAARASVKRLCDIGYTVTLFGPEAAVRAEVARSVRGRMGAFSGWVVTAIIFAFATPFTSQALFLALNRLADGSPLAVHETVVTSVRSERHARSPTTCYITVPSWRAGASSLELPVPCEDSRAAGQRVTIRTGPGLFGCEWLDSVK